MSEAAHLAGLAGRSSGGVLNERDYTDQAMATLAATLAALPGFFTPFAHTLSVHGAGLKPPILANIHTESAQVEIDNNAFLEHYLEMINSTKITKH